MEKIIQTKWIISVLCCVGACIASAQEHTGRQLHDHDHEGHTHDAVHDPFIANTPVICTTEEDYERDMLPLLVANVAMLEAEGRLAPRDISSKSIGTFQWPLRMSAQYASIYGVGDYYITGNYADLIPGKDNGKKDWMCATGSSARNYDGHNGADILPFPFQWLMLKQGAVDMIAAATGQVIAFQDGNFDRNCAAPHIQGTYPGFSGYGNFVALIHPDNSISIYGHMKNGSVANLEIGQSVSVGQYLGKVGSSGNSTAPHIHFEVRPCLTPADDCKYVEPWWTNNGCNTTVSNSWWADQKPFYDKAVNRVMTLASVPGSPTCSNVENNDATETVHIRNHFNSGSTVTMGVFLRDFNTGDGLSVRMYSPTNVLLQTWTTTATEYHRWGYAFYPTRTMSGATSGTYRVEATFAGKTVKHYFSIGCTGNYTLSGAQTGSRGWIASNSITSTQALSASSLTDVFYEAGSSVTLNPGFITGIGSKLYINIDQCTINGAIMPQDEDEEPVLNDVLETLEVFPNPSGGQFTVRAIYQGDNTGAEVIVRNSLGQVVAQRKAPPGGGNQVEMQFTATELTPGMYFVEYIASGSHNVQKLIIQ